MVDKLLIITNNYSRSKKYSMFKFVKEINNCVNNKQNYITNIKKSLNFLLIMIFSVLTFKVLFLIYLISKTKIVHCFYQCLIFFVISLVLNLDLKKIPLLFLYNKRHLSELASVFDTIISVGLKARFT